MTKDQLFFYANQRSAQMVRRPLEQVIGTSCRDFLADDGRAALRSLLKRADKLGARVRMILQTGQNTQPTITT